VVGRVVAAPAEPDPVAVGRPVVVVLVAGTWSLRAGGVAGVGWLLASAARRPYASGLRIRGPRGGRRHEVRTFATTTAGLLQVFEWLTSQQVTRVGMEATGVYWKPVYYLLEDTFDTQLLYAQHMHNVPGRKTDLCPTRPGSSNWSNTAWSGPASCPHHRSASRLALYPS
jgi:hypothetical protein